MALRASERRLALALIKNSRLIPLAPRGTSGERVGERGFVRLRRLLSPSLLRFAEERESPSAFAVLAMPELNYSRNCHTAR